MDFYRKYKNFKHFLSSIKEIIKNGYPARNLTVIGVTGTDGKTTTCHLIYSILKQAQLQVALVSSVAAFIGEKEIDTGFHVTTPDARFLQPLLRKFVNQGVQYLVLETTSHGLDQHRVLGCNFSIGVLTNVTHEHLDYHKTFKRYIAAKAKLFSKAKIAVLNRDDKHFNYLKRTARKAKVVTYGIDKKADFTLKRFKFKTKLPGKFNLYNCLAAIATTSTLGIDNKTIKKAILSFKPVKGRMEEVKGGQKFRVIIDFAHTPNSLEKTLTVLKKKRDKGRLIVVFGCAGERDFLKRPLMGGIATKLADFVVLTAEDPRTESVDKIIAQIVEGCQKTGGEKDKTFFCVPDRQKAINFAVRKLARKNDIVAICGKGHEKSMCFGKKEFPWSDKKAVEKALKV